MKHCTRKRNLNTDNFHSLFPNCDSRGQTFFRQNDFAWICFLIATNRFLHIPNSTAMWECVCYLLIDYIVYMVNNQSNRAQGSGLLRRVLLFWTRSENESELGVFSSVYRWRRRRLKRKCCLRFRSLSQHEIESIYYVGQGLWEIYSRFIFF
jgi:hypothetical protein